MSLSWSLLGREKKRRGVHVTGLEIKGETVLIDETAR